MLNEKNADIGSGLQAEILFNLPVSLPAAVGSPPVAQDGSAVPTEYYVLALDSLKSIELEEKLNDASRQGWSLFQIIRQAQQMLLVFWRHRHSA